MEFFLSFIFFPPLLPLCIDWIGRPASVLSWRANTAGSKASLHQDQHSRCHSDFYLFFPVGRHRLVSERHTTGLRGSESFHASPLFCFKNFFFSCRSSILHRSPIQRQMIFCDLHVLFSCFFFLLLLNDIIHTYIFTPRNAPIRFRVDIF